MEVLNVCKNLQLAIYLLINVSCMYFDKIDSHYREERHIGTRRFLKD